MKKYHNNPRQIKEKNFLELKKSLEEFGDLSGIVHNLDTDEILSGNQRFEALNLNDYEEKITERFDPPTQTGTSYNGQIIIDGEPYKVRHVTGWSEEKCQRAVLAANSRKLQGEYDMDILSSWDEGIVNEYVDEWEKGIFGEDEDNDDCEYPIVRKYDEKYDAIIIVSDNEINTTHIRELLGLGKMKSYKNSSIGESYVIDDREFIKKWNSR
jgi:hypothetical protein